MRERNKMVRESLSDVCQFPVYIRGSRLFIHPKDFKEITRKMHFIGGNTLGIVSEKDCIGAYFGLQVFPQDDLMIIMLAILGEKDWDSCEDQN